MNKITKKTPLLVKICNYTITLGCIALAITTVYGYKYGWTSPRQPQPEMIGIEDGVEDGVEAIVAEGPVMFPSPIPNPNPTINEKTGYLDFDSNKKDKDKTDKEPIDVGTLHDITRTEGLSKILTSKGIFFTNEVISGEYNRKVTIKRGEDGKTSI